MASLLRLALALTLTLTSAAAPYNDYLRECIHACLFDLTQG
jgi:hypothetical protein